MIASFRVWKMMGEIPDPLKSLSAFHSLLGSGFMLKISRVRVGMAQWCTGLPHAHALWTCKICCEKASSPWQDMVFGALEDTFGLLGDKPLRTLEWGHLCGNLKNLAKGNWGIHIFLHLNLSVLGLFFFALIKHYNDVEEIKSWISQYPLNLPPPFPNRGTARSYKEGPWSFIQMQTNLSMRIYHSLTFFFKKFISCVNTKTI